MAGLDRRFIGSPGTSLEAVLFKAACLKFITVLRNILPVPGPTKDGGKVTVETRAVVAIIHGGDG